MPLIESKDAEAPVKQRQATLGLVTIFCTYFASIYFFRGSAVTAPKIAADLDGMALFSWAISLPALAAATDLQNLPRFSVAAASLRWPSRSR